MPSSSPPAPDARLGFPDDELRQPWLRPLLEAYHIVDDGVREAIRREQAQGRELACGKGCAACCRSHTSIPVYPLELMGITWYVVEKLRDARRTQLMAQLSDFQNIPGCPFLIDEACSIHPLRPMACRQFNVFGTRCREGEDAYYTRRQDVMNPIKRYADEAFDVMLPFYGMKHKAERREAIAKGQQHALARVMRECHWDTVAGRMADYDRGRVPNGG